MSRSTTEIMEEAERRRQANLGRNQDYITLRATVHGLYYDRKAQDIMDGQGRVILRDNRRANEANPIVANLLKAIVDDYVALTGQMPDTKVPKPGTEQSDQVFADMVEKYHYGVQHSSRWKLHLKAMAWFNSSLGSCSGIVWPNFMKRHADMRILGPDKVYGVPDLLDPFAYSSAVTIESYSARTIRDYFPNKKLRTFVEEQTEKRSTWWGEADRVEVIRWFDKDEVVTILGREQTTIKGRKKEGHPIEAIIEMGRVQHYVGQCLVVPFQNLLIPGELRSISDIEEAVGLNQWLNFLLNAHEEGIKQELFAPLILIDPEKAPEDIDLSNPMEIIPIRKGGDAKRLPGPTSAQQVMSSEMQRGQQLIEYVTGSSAIRTQGRQPSSSIATGRSLEKGQSPQMTRIEYRNDLNATSIEKMNELSVLMTGRQFENDDVKLFGTHGRSQSMFKTTIKGKDLQDYTFNMVLYPPSMYMGMEQRIVAMEQLLGGNHPMVSVRTAMEFIGLVDHPDEEIAEIEADQMRMVEHQKKMQGDQGGGQPQGPASVLERNVALNSGSTKPAPGAGAASLPAGGTATGGGGPAGGPSTPAISPAPGSAPAPGGAPQGLDPNIPPPEPPADARTSGLGGSLSSQVESIVSTTKLKGPAYVSEKGKDKVEVIVTSQPDVLKLRRKLMPLFKGQVTVKEGKPPPDAKEVGGKQ
jgi:hypothetical protein